MGPKSPFCCWESLPLPPPTSFLTPCSFQPELSQALDLYLETLGTLWNELGGGEPWRLGEYSNSLQTSWNTQGPGDTLENTHTLENEAGSLG